MNKRLSAWVALVGMCLMAGAAQAGGDPKEGEGKAALCGGCHGGTGNSEDATFPRLAGQYENYIVKQIRDFQRGLRTNNETMAGMAATIASDQDAKDIAAYFSQQKIEGKPLASVDRKLAEKGEQIFREGNPKTGVYACINCHGERGRGRSPNVSTFPVIGGQHRDYIMKELKDFKGGLRTNDPAGMMSDIAKKLTDEEIEAVANYLSSLI